MKPTLSCLAALILVTIMASSARAEVNQAGIKTVTDTPGLVAFWTFGEAAGHPRLSVGTKKSYPLMEKGGAVARVAGGPFSGYAAKLDGHHFFDIPHDKTGDLNIGGKGAQVSMFAVVWIPHVEHCRTIAGMWDEGHGAYDDTGTRQYAMLLHMPMYGGDRRLTPHISGEGGVTRRADGSALPWCADYAATAHEVPEGQWCTLGFTYDGQYIRAYINGVLDKRDARPEYDHRTDRYFTREGPGRKNRGMNPYYLGKEIYRYDAKRDAKTKPRGGSDFTVGSRTAGGEVPSVMRLGGLAVFDRALSDAEMLALHQAAKRGIAAERK